MNAVHTSSDRNLCGKTMKRRRESETIEKTVRRKENGIMSDIRLLSAYFIGGVAKQQGALNSI